VESTFKLEESQAPDSLASVYAALMRFHVSSLSNSPFRTRFMAVLKRAEQKAGFCAKQTPSRDKQRRAAITFILLSIVTLKRPLHVGEIAV